MSVAKREQVRASDACYLQYQGTFQVIICKCYPQAQKQQQRNSHLT